MKFFECQTGQLIEHIADGVKAEIIYLDFDGLLIDIRLQNGEVRRRVRPIEYRPVTDDKKSQRQ